MGCPVIDLRPRCGGCGKLLAIRVTRPWVIQCPRCKGINSESGQQVRLVIVMDTRGGLDPGA